MEDMMSDDSDALSRAFAHAMAYLEGLDGAPVAARASLSDLRARLGKPLPERGLGASHVVDDLVADVAGGINGSQGGRFYAWVIGGGLPAAMAADWLTTVWDQNAGIHATSPAAAVVEEVAGEWLKELFGLPRESSFGFVTGTQMGHAACLAAARNAVLARAGWDVERKGLFGAPRVRVLANAERHGSVDRAVRLLGFGSESVEALAVDDEGRVQPGTLEAALKASGEPAIVALQAGELNLAAFDPFDALAPVARKHGAWVHVDGAFGLWARVSPTHRRLAEGIELCDSWVTDGHKYLNVPYDSGFAFVRNAQAHRAAMTLGGVSYLPEGGAARDAIDWNPEFSRRARGFAAYAAIRQLGREGLAEMVDRTCAHVEAMAERIGALPGAERLGAAGLNQALVRFNAGPGSRVEDGDRRTERVIAAINASGEAMFGGVTWRGRRAMRISLVNWRTTDADVDRAVAAAERALAGG
jgi:glutamate/tyrosine decarboxylase-like PLP-dependent enzyme